MKNIKRISQNRIVRKRFYPNYDNQFGNGGTILSSALSGAGTGASIGLGTGGLASPWLAAGGFALGALTGILKDNEEKKALDAQEKAKREEENRINRLNKEIHLQNNANVLNSYATDGYNQSGFYKYGGVLKENDSNIMENRTNVPVNGRSIGNPNGAVPIGRQSIKMVGDKHGQDSDGDGQGGIPYKGNEVEDGEIIYKMTNGDELVFSKKLGFADMVEPFLRERAILEKELNSTDKIKRNTALRKIQAIDDKVKLIYNKQQKVNGNNVNNPNNQQQFGDGGKLATGISIAQAALPFIDRAFSQKKLNQIDRNVPEPVLNEYTMLNRDVDVNPQINDLNQGQKALLDNINANTANSNVASARASFVTGKTIDAKNKIYAQQRQQQLAIDNANTQGVNRTNELNNSLLNDHIKSQFEHTNDRISTEIGLNQGLTQSVSNTLTNLQKGLYQDSELDVLALQYGLRPEDFKSREALRQALLERTKKLFDTGQPNDGQLNSN